MLVTTRAIVATGSYAPEGLRARVARPAGRRGGGRRDALIRVVRDQIGHGADWIKVYADYRWGPGGEARPTFTLDELKRIVETARASGRAGGGARDHAGGDAAGDRSPASRRSSTATAATPEVFRLMAKHGVALCPTLAAGEAMRRYRGWKKGSEPGAGERSPTKRASFKAALDAGRDHRQRQRRRACSRTATTRASWS